MLRWLRGLAALRGVREAPVPPDPLLLDAYLRLGGRPGGAEPLALRLEVLVGQLSAELSGCRWCIEAGRHSARKAGVPPETMASLHAIGPASCFTEPERAALAFAAAVARGAATDRLVSGPVLAAARRHFSEREIVRLTILAAGEHFGDCLAGRFGSTMRLSYPIAVRGLP